MTIRLLYHDPNSPGGVSPFDDAIRSIAREGQLSLACPYISLHYLKQIIEGTSWRLLTDIEGWLPTQSATKRKLVVEFLRTHHASVRNYPQLHAKVVIGLRTFLFGSANFTKKGIHERAEVSAIVDDDAQVQELTRWFQACWDDAYELLPRLDAIAEYSNALPERPASGEDGKPRLFPPIAPKQAAPAVLEVQQAAADQATEQLQDQASEQSPTEDIDDVVFHFPPSSAKASPKAKQSNSQKDVRRYLFRVIRIGRTAQAKDIPFLHALATETAIRSPDRFGPNASNAGIRDNERQHRTAVRLARTVSDISLPALRDAARDVRLNNLSNLPQYSEDYDDEVRKELGVK